MKKSRNYNWLWISAFVVLLLDQLTKWLITRAVPENGSIAVITNVFYLSHVWNTGAAFSILTGQNIFLILVSIAALGAIIYYLKVEDRRYSLALFLILGGVLGNLIDRIRLGYVTDFLDFRIWPVFNVADWAITVGTVMLIYQIYIKEKIEKRK